MSLSARAQSRVPPGFRFHPTEEELLHYYLRKKVACENIDLDVIQDVDLNKLEPWDIQDKCRIGSTPQNDWYFFSHKDKKYPTGTRTNRATAAGFWKATGRDKVIYANSRRIGMRKTLVFYKGRAPHGLKSDWIMHEYRLDDHTDSTCSHSIASDSLGEATQEEGWVVCRVFKKKNNYKTTESADESKINSESPENFFNSGNDGTLDQILQGMGPGCKQETEVKNNNSTIQLPQLESQTLLPKINDWAALDLLVASHLSGQEEASKSLACFNDPTLSLTTSQPFDSFFNDSDQELQLPQLRSTNMLLFNNNQDYSCDIDLWSFARSSASSSNPLTSYPHTSNSGFVSTTSG